MSSDDPNQGAAGAGQSASRGPASAILETVEAVRAQLTAILRYVIVGAVLCMGVYYLGGDMARREVTGAILAYGVDTQAVLATTLGVSRDLLDVLAAVARASKAYR